MASRVAEDGVAFFSGDGAAAFVELGVVVAADEQEVVGVGGSTVEPVFDVVGVEVDAAGAAGKLAVAVA